MSTRCREYGCRTDGPHQHMGNEVIITGGITGPLPPPLSRDQELKEGAEAQANHFLARALKAEGEADALRDLAWKYKIELAAERAMLAKANEQLAEAIERANAERAAHDWFRYTYKAKRWALAWKKAATERREVSSAAWIAELNDTRAVCCAAVSRAEKAEADPRLRAPLDGPGSHRADLEEMRALGERAEKADAKQWKLHADWGKTYWDALKASEARAEALDKLHQEALARAEKAEAEIEGHRAAASIFAVSESEWKALALAAEARARTARSEALEEAAKVADAIEAEEGKHKDTPGACIAWGAHITAAAIRALAKREEP